ncbi:MAG: hypothetical protein HYU52_13470 [Acidobacteria bacterium]|nr:hypothetical protein [Acidobacteriota bacterium]
MKSATRPSRIGALALIVLLAGATRCASWRQEVKPLPALVAASRDSAWDELLRLRRAAPRLASYASIRVETGKSKQSFKATIATDERGRLRVDAFSPMGTAAFTLYVDGDEATMVDHVNRTWWKGPFPVAAKSLGLPDSLGAHAVVMLAFGLPAWSLESKSRDGAASQNGVSYVVQREGLEEAEGNGWRARFEPASYPASRVTISTADGSRAMTVRHLEAGEASRDVKPPRIEPSYRCCVEPVGWGHTER